MKKIIEILFFSKKSKEEVWEYDFILNELITNNVPVKSHFLSFDEVKNNNQEFDIFVYSCRDPEEYYWGYTPSYRDVLECVLKTKPKIIIQLSDEYKNENLDHHNHLANYCELFLRQYNHQEYRNGVIKNNIINIPLGYANKTPINKINIIPASERKYNWSFIGKIKDWEFCFFDEDKQKWCSVSDRAEMIEVFKTTIDQFFFVEHGVHIDQLVEIYNNSIFVPCGRGNSSLNCFRNYEATICGAIPVVVYRYPEEIDIEFKYIVKPDYWIFASSWKEASDICNYLLQHPEKLKYLQEQNLKWWKCLIENIQRRIMYALFKK
jgi:hypothetical protein